VSFELKAPEDALPLVRHISWRTSRVLARFPITPNQITFVAMVAGLACNWLLTYGEYHLGIVAALLLVACYVLDHSDGDIARLKKLHSEFGMRFDSFVDWIVNATFFVCLGYGEMLRTGNELWLWLGAAGTAGGTINYLIGFYLDARHGVSASVTAKPGTPRMRGFGDMALFAFRELTRADFCFIVLALALVDQLWLLVPAGAIGAQVYWMTAFIKRAREYHV
jgi:phosphatidylglycerophosphate synthase